MINLTGRDVLLARLHTTIHVPGVGQIGGTEALDKNSKFFKTLVMTKVDDGLHVIGSKPTSPTFEIFIPNGNLASLVLSPLPKETAPDKAKK